MSALSPREFDRFVIQGRAFPFTSAEEVSAAYRATIERLGIGGSQTPACIILDSAGNETGYVSYNGRVWRGRMRDWQPGKEPVYCPTAREAR
jgi:hypothetical protein